MESNGTKNMCTRFYVDDETYCDIRTLAVEMESSLEGRHWDRDIHPSEAAPVLVRASARDGLKLTEQYFGFPGRSNGKLVLNARAESVFEKKIFRDGIRFRRAVIPAKHFYEWNRNKEKNTFSREDGSPLFLAGFYGYAGEREWFMIITTAANRSVERIHGRMPLILEKSQLKEWIFHDFATGDILKQEPAPLHRESDFEQLSLFS